MNQQELTIITNNIKGQITDKLIAPLCIAGAPGTGKSTQIRLIAEELRMNLITQSAPCLTVESLSGLPNEYAAPQYQAFAIDGAPPQATAWSIPELIAATLRAASEKPTILLLDDFHMVPPHLQAYFYSLLLERRLGNYRLADNVAIILTMNDSELAGFSGISSPVRNRLSILPIEFNFEHWLNTFGNRLHYLVASFLRAKPHFCIEPETTSVEGFASARAWTSIAAELSVHTDDFLQANAKRIAGMQVSHSAAQAFQTHVNYVGAIDFTKTVTSRTLVDLAKQDPLDSIIYAYITNFINTVDDGLYLFDLLTTNKNQSVFVGFIFGELYTKYINVSADHPLSDGLLFVIDKLLNMPMEHSKYAHTSKEKLTKVFAEEIPNRSHFMGIAQEYLL
jgi:MoxR-like ATPase